MKRLSYNDFSKTDYKSILTLILVVAFVFVAGRYLYKHIRQDIKDFGIKNNVKQEQLKEETPIVQETEEPKAEMEKVYTEAEKQADMKVYKDKFIARVKKHWQPQYESFLIDDNSSIEVNINRDGEITCPEYDKQWADATYKTMYNAITYEGSFYPLPESYDGHKLSFKVYFEGNSDLYFGKANQPKQSYQVGLNPIKIQNNVRTQSPAQIKKTETPAKKVKYNVYVGSYNSSFQANKAKEVIIESYAELSPTVKELGNNQYVLLIGTYYNKTSAEEMYNKLQNMYYLPAKIVNEDY